MANEVSILRGQSYSREFTFTGSNGMPYNLTGLTVWVRLFKDFADAPIWSFSSVADPSKVIVLVPSSGIVRVTLTPTDTDIDERVYSYLLFATDVLGNVVPLLNPTSFYVREAGLP